MNKRRLKKLNQYTAIICAVDLLRLNQEGLNFLLEMSQHIDRCNKCDRKYYAIKTERLGLIEREYGDIWSKDAEELAGRNEFYLSLFNRLYNPNYLSSN